MNHSTRTARKHGCISLLLTTLALAWLSGPAATQLQMRRHTAAQAADIDVVYLVCGARAQYRRLQAMEQWLRQHDTRHIQIWIGNDTHNSLWSRKHQRNLTRAEWAYEHAIRMHDAESIRVLPGAFSNTDGEMQALAATLQRQPDIRSIAFVTCGFHARRTLARFAVHATGPIETAVIPVVPHWENRAPWIVAAEWLKILRDHLNLTQHPRLSRQQ